MRRARARSRAGGDPPRCQAGQCDGARRARRRRRLCQAGRLRSGTRDRRRSAHAYRRRRGDARLHGPRAGRGNEGDSGVRRLLARPLALRGVDRHEPHPRRRPGRHRAASRPPAALARARAPRPAARAVRRDRRCARRRSGPPPRPGGAPGRARRGGARARRPGRIGGAGDAEASGPGHGRAAPQPLVSPRGLGGRAVRDCRGGWGQACWRERSPSASSRPSAPSRRSRRPPRPESPLSP